jgi:hypothetical protein
MPVTRFTITKPPPRPLSAAETAAKYKLPRAEAEAVTQYVARDILPVRSTPSGRFVGRSKAKRKVAAKRAR